MRAVRSAVIVACIAAPCVAQDVGLGAWPPAVTLDSARDAHRIVVLATDAQSITREVTATAEASFTANGIAIFADGVLRPLHDGETELRFEWQGATAAVKVVVRNASESFPISFRNDVEPVLMRAGCNAGACHGAAIGKNGFGLSLFGYDPAADHRALTRDQRGRRLDCSDPAASLMLAKPTNAVRHKGGRRFTTDDPAFATLRDWIGEGANDDGAAAPGLIELRIDPPELVLAGVDHRTRLVVTATYDDGSLRDVTELAVLSSSSNPTAHLTAGELVSAGRGEAFVLARFGFLAAVAQVVVLPDDEPWTAPAMEARGEIDQLVQSKLRKLRLAPSPICDDSAFVRRIHLDLCARLPTVDEVRAFLADDSPDKRARLIDTLLVRDELADVLTAQWAELLRIEPDRLERKGAYVYTAWLREQFRARVPFDAIVRRLLTANGSAFRNPPANYWVVAQDPRVLAENAAQSFLGIRVQCAQCHNHPFERWTLDDYYGFAAFFGQVGRKGGDDPRDTIIFDQGRGEVPNSRNGRTSKARFLGGPEPDLPAGIDRREVLAAWLTGPDDPAFARNIANRIWAHLLGRGIVEPVDDVRVSNPASHPGLHRRLGERLMESGYDLHGLIREICNSATYQAAAIAEGVPAATFAGAEPRRLAAEALIDAIDAVTGVPTKFRGVPIGGSATRIVEANANDRFFDLFGRPLRESVCACERSEEPTLNQVLHLINGDTIEKKVQAKDGRIARLVAAGAEAGAIVEELFLAAYARPPRDDERARILALLEAGGDARAVWEDVAWAVLNSKEFLFWH